MNKPKTFPFLIVPKASKREKNEGLEGEGKIPERYGEMKGTSEHAPNRQNKQQNHHPTVKPIKLMSYLIMLASREGDIVLDPFVGSGTTCIAAQNLNRKYIGIDKSEEYCKIARARLKQVQQTLL